MRIDEIKKKKSVSTQAYEIQSVDFSEVTGSIVAVVTDVQKNGSRSIGLGFKLHRPVRSK